METGFWHERWRNKQIGFHKEVPNAYLTTYWQDLDAPKDCQVFVPLCGKSLDMIWLAARGHQVIGVELSEIAIREFFEAAGLEPKVSDTDGVSLFETPNIKIYCGDIFSI